MQPGIPQEKIIVMDAHADEISRTGFFVERHQTFGIPLLRLSKAEMMSFQPFVDG